MTSVLRHKQNALWAVCAAALALSGAGCRQRMADQPYYRPLEQTEFFPDGRASRPIERGTIHRAQYLETDPMATGLTLEEWGRAYEFAVPMKLEAAPLADAERIKRAVGAPRYNPLDAGQPKVYVKEYPFAITQADLKRGQDRFTIYCAVCHGPLGNGQGKIWERGYLTPTSFHTQKVTPTEVDLKNPAERLGYSRGFKLWGHEVPMTDVPEGYIFEVITKGYGGMPSYSAQIPPADRWKIIAYIRVLQMSQRTDPAKLPPEVKKLLDPAGGKP
jgi:mono/diheme cytochrome c family protein